MTLWRQQFDSWVETDNVDDVNEVRGKGKL